MTDRRVTEDTAITGANVATGDLFDLVDVSDTTDASTGTNKSITAAELRKIVSTLYDATAHTASIIADGGSVTVQDDIDFVSHGKLDLDHGFDPGDGEGVLPTWYDPANTQFDQGGWFAFGYTPDKVSMHFGYEQFVGLSFEVQSGAVFVQFGGGGDSWDFSELTIYGSSPSTTGNHIDMWASDGFGGYFALYPNGAVAGTGSGKPVLEVATAGAGQTFADCKIGFFSHGLSSQAAHIATPTDLTTLLSTTVPALITALQGYGLLAAV